MNNLVISQSQKQPDGFKSLLQQIFEGQEFRYIAKLDKEVLFVAKDICGILEIKDHKSAIRKLDEDEKGEQIIPTLGGKQTMTVINESGLYSLIFSSNKPVAKRFKKYITGTVLPEIRKTGNFISEKNLSLQQEARKHFTREEYQALLTVRQETKELCRRVTNALKNKYGADIKSHHYSNELTMLCKLVTGMSPKEFRLKFNVKSVRDNLPIEQLSLLAELENRDVILIEDGLKYQECREKLQAYINMKYSQLVAS